MQKNIKSELETVMNNTNENKEMITFGAGCFWCVEAIFQLIEGVSLVESGYSGGESKNPTYKEICTGTTGHAEVCQLTYDSSMVSFDELLEIFWKSHDPTTLNRQGGDVGTQYRSVIFYHTNNQKERAEYFKEKLNKSNAFPNPIVTEISPIGTFFKAENYHQEYFETNGSQPYCQMVIRPKVDKLKQTFRDKLKL